MDLKARTTAIIKWILGGLVALLLLLGILFALAQTNMGRRQLATWLAARLSSRPDIQVKIGRIDGLVPFDVRLDRLSTADGVGEWLVLENVALRWSPAQLLRGRLYLNEISATTVRIERLPPSRQDDGMAAKKLPRWPPACPSLIVERLVIEKLALGASVLGQKAVFTIQGQMNISGPTGDLAASLRIDRVDGPKAQATVSCTLVGKLPVLTLHAKVEESENGLLSTSLGFNQAGPLAIDLHGEGPLEAWQGQLLAEAEKIGSIEAVIGCIAQKDLRLTAEGTVRAVSSALPSVLVSLVRKEEGHFAFDVGYHSRRELVVHQAHLETDDAALNLTGRLHLKKQDISADFTLGIRDLSSLETLISTRMKGRLTVQGNLSGPVQQPLATLSMMLQNTQVGELQASSIESELLLKPLRPLASAFPGLLVEGKGRVEGLKHGQEDGLPESRFHWSLSTQIPTQWQMAIEKLNLESENIRLTFSGQADPVDLSLKGDAAVEVRDLRILSALWGPKLPGETVFNARLEVDGRSNSLFADIAGEIGGLTSLSSLLGTLTGPKMTYHGLLKLGAGHLRITDLQCHSAAASLTAAASLDFSNEEIKGQGHLDIPRLAVLSRPIGRPLDGTLETDVEIAGPLRSLKLIAKTTGGDISIGGIRVHRAVATLHVEGVPERPQGRLQLELHVREQPVRAMTTFVLDGPRLTLSNLSMVGSGTQCRGNLSFDRQGLVAEGVLQGKSEDLSRLSSFLGEEISGSAELKAEFGPGKIGQTVTFHLNGRELTTRFGQAKGLRMKGQLMDLFNLPSGEAEITVNALKKDHLTLDKLILMATGDMKKVAFSGQASGRYGENFSIQTKGILNATRKTEQQLELHQFQGRYREHPVVLTKPIMIKHLPDGYTMEGLSLQVGQGHIQASGSISAKAIAFAGNCERLPLDVIRLNGIPDLTGSASGRLDIAGQPGHPEGSLQLHLTGVRLQGDAFKTFPPATVISKAELRQDLLRATFSVEGLAQKPIKASVELPVNLSLSPLALSLPPRGEVRGRLAAEVNLAPVSTLLYLEDQNLEGMVSVDLTLAGRIEAPEITGSARIEKAGYENIHIGTILKDIHAQITTRERRFFIQKASASDGEKGAISAQGWLELAPAKNFPFQLDIHLKDAELVRQDDLTGTASGQVSLSGSRTDATVMGKIDIGPAEYQIPDRLPPEITELEVIEINRPEQDTQLQQTPRARKAHRLRLNLQLNLPSRVFIRGRGLDSEWKGALDVKGSVREPTVMGTLTVVRGHINLFGKRFILTRADCTFKGDSPPSPDFNVVAEHKRSDITARVRFTGAPSALVVTLESDPPLPEDEILARVLFGRSVTTITPMQALQLAQAINTLAGGGGKGVDLLGRARKLLGVEQLDVKPGDQGDGKTSVSIGKYLLEGVYVEVDKVVDTGLDPEGDKVSVEVEITPNISVETETGIDGQGGVGLNWKWEY